MADQLGCSVDYLLGRTEVMAVAAAPIEDCPSWRDGAPERDGDYWCKVRDVDIGASWTDEVEWLRGRWKVRDYERVEAWYPLPEE